MREWNVEESDISLNNHVLHRKIFSDRLKDTEHEHCEFCSALFGSQKRDFVEGYCTEDYYYWICDHCYNEFKDEFNWTIKS